jgi:Xaa-Pro aminopeptidase
MRETVRARLSDAVDRLRDDGLDGLLAVNNGDHSFLDANAVFVLSGYRAVGESALVLDRDGGSTLVVTPAWDGERARRMAQATSVIATSDLADGIERAVTERGLQRGRLATVGLGTLGQAQVERIEKVIGRDAPARDDLARDLARVRSGEERAAAERAVAIAEQGYQAALECVRPGMREYELTAELMCAMKGLGAEDNFLLVSASQHNYAVRAAGRRILEEGDVILAEISPCHRGQFVQICRTVTIGEPREEVSRNYALMQSAMRAGQAAARSGTRVADVARAMNAVLEDAGYGDYCRQPYMRVRGHGLGITSNQPGDIGVENDRILEDGMIFVMHPNQYLPKSGYLLCGDTVVVTPSGAVSLSSKPAALDSVRVSQ